MDDAAQSLKQLRIKSGSVKRLAQELKLYTEDQAKEAKRVEDMRASGADSHDIKHAENVLQEATMIIPDTRSRLEAAYEDLLELKRAAEESAQVKESEEYKAAQELIQGLESVVGEM
eukprot:CAMPEP_0206143360 /NCGR_PEP_ID=MMETSP1473-20131121/20253_1 /ASSEMBLY_ACC=CAM_ASM_001109 /TAXON_ID=1461547 /ORGANISM="Stichococcus sp, Strain RCC1054" /LENGTH=116 /DNA_ID=CAMNT_0053538723 /DNA_START=194 /DNA_END=544 /DNA_ORIENTATION=-